MASVTNYAQNKLIDALLRAQSLSAPATFYAALYTVAPTATSGSGTEVTGGAYARQAITSSLANWAGTQGAGTTVASTGTSGTTSNNAQIQFPVATASWGTVVDLALLDALTAGNMWMFGTLGSSLAVSTGGQPTFAAATLTFSIT
jgi:hypothetical protein